MTTLARRDAARTRAEMTYNAAACHFDAQPLAFWDRHGSRAVDLLEPRPGDHVLDVGCGTGASALPAAAAVGKQGYVIGIDVAEAMLDRARAKATAQNRQNVSFHNMDMRDSGLPVAHFDAVISVFSLFFVDDMHGLLQELWRKVRPGGKLAVTTWGPRAFQPCADIFAHAMSKLRPLRNDMSRPWERLDSEDKLRALFRGVSTRSLDIVSVSDHQPLRTPKDWWTIVLGSGYRSEIDGLAKGDRARVRDSMLQRISTADIGNIDTSVIHMIAQKD